jgi:hypothetical protein
MCEVLIEPFFCMGMNGVLWLAGMEYWEKSVVIKVEAHIYVLK